MKVERPEGSSFYTALFEAPLRRLGLKTGKLVSADSPRGAAVTLEITNAGCETVELRRLDSSGNSTRLQDVPPRQRVRVVSCRLAGTVYARGPHGMLLLAVGVECSCINGIYGGAAAGVSPERRHSFVAREIERTLTPLRAAVDLEMGESYVVTILPPQAWEGVTPQQRPALPAAVTALLAAEEEAAAAEEEQDEAPRLTDAEIDAAVDQLCARAQAQGGAGPSVAFLPSTSGLSPPVDSSVEVPYTDEELDGIIDQLASRSRSASASANGSVRSGTTSRGDSGRGEGSGFRDDTARSRGALAESLEEHAKMLTSRSISFGHEPSNKAAAAAAAAARPRLSEPDVFSMVPIFRASS
mmetsp:Transcript_24116/g.78568  ORF Transcript_24116/g.78568 Transcript_24116/m.78568 type:complete len:356 (-) Transcript_24116:48-1115(-)